MVTVRTYWAWETTATLRLFGDARGARAGGGEGRGISCRHAHSLFKEQRTVVFVYVVYCTVPYFYLRREGFAIRLRLCMPTCKWDHSKGHGIR